MDPISRKELAIGAHRHIQTESPSQNQSVTIPTKVPAQDQPDEKRVNQGAKKTNTLFSFIFKRFNKSSTREPNQLQGKRFTYLASGKAKKVYQDNTSDKFVYYTPVKGIFEKLFGRKKAEIQEEVKLAAAVRGSLVSAGISSEGESHIATDLVEIKGSHNLEGKYVVQAPKAGEGGKKADLDKLLQDKIPLADRFNFCEQLLKGLGHLHKAGYVHGDLKGDNILHFKERQSNGEVKSILRLGDFGKSRKVEEDGSILHTGNPRFAAPEGRTSKKAEVFSAALLLVRILEEEILQKETGDMVISPEKSKSDQAGEGLRGVVKFVVTNDKCVQTNAKNISGKIRLIAGSARAIRNVRGEKEKSSSDEVKKYIHALFSKLKEEKSTNEVSSLEQMEKLLLNMVDEDPAQRPTMSSALGQFEDALKLYRGGIAS